MLSDAKALGEQYLAKTKLERDNVIAKVQDSFGKTSSAIVLNAGNLFHELLNEASNLIQYVQVSKECDQRCAYKCFNRKKPHLPWYNPECLERCNCQFKLERLD